MVNRERVDTCGESDRKRVKKNVSTRKAQRVSEKRERGGERKSRDGMSAPSVAFATAAAHSALLLHSGINLIA